MKRSVFNIVRGSTMLLCAIASLSVSGEPLRFVWNSYCPFTCQQEKTGQTGYAMEISRRVFDNSPYEVSYDYVISWNRALVQVQRGEADAIVFSYVEKQLSKKFVVPTTSLAFETNTTFIVKRDNPWRFESIRSLKQLKRIGVYKNTTWHYPELSSFERNNPQKFVYLHGDEIVSRAISLIRRGRLDAWEDSQILLSYQIFNQQISDMRLETLSKGELHSGSMLFSRKHPKAQELAAYFSKKVDLMEKRGELVKILRRYGIENRQGKPVTR